MNYYLVFQDEKSNKFWQLEQSGSGFTVTFGKIGTAGQSQTKEFASAEDAQKEAEKLANSKRKKGYTDAEPGAAASAPKNEPAKKETEAKKADLAPKEKTADKSPKAKPASTQSEESEQRINQTIDAFKQLVDQTEQGLLERADTINQAQPLGCGGLNFRYDHNYREREDHGGKLREFSSYLTQHNSEYAEYDKDDKRIYLAEFSEIGEPFYTVSKDWDPKDEFEPFILPCLLEYIHAMLLRHPDRFFPKVHIHLEVDVAFEFDGYVYDEPRYRDWLKGVEPQLEPNIEPVRARFLQLAQKGYENMRASIESERAVDPGKKRYAADERTWCTDIKLTWKYLAKGKKHELSFDPKFSNTYYEPELFSDDYKLFFNEAFESEPLLLSPEQFRQIVPDIAAFFSSKLSEDPAFFFPSFNINIILRQGSLVPELPDETLVDHEASETLVDESRLDAWREDMLELIATGYERYKDTDLMPVAGFEALQVMKLMPEVGYEAVDHCLEAMFKHCEDSWWRGDDEIVDALKRYGIKTMSSYGENYQMLVGNQDGFVAAPEEYHDMLSLIALKVMVHTTNSSIDTEPPKMLRYLSKSGSQRAKDIVKFGTGAVAREYTELKDKEVDIVANDIKQLVTITIKKETESAYRKAVVFLKELLAHGFNPSFNLKLKSSEKNYVPDTWGDDLNRFWSNAAQYPALFPEIKDYIRIAQEEGRYSTYLDDMEDDGEDVPLGGYALYALAHYAVGDENDDIIAEYMSGNDTEHNSAMDNIVKIVAARTKFATESFPLLAACIIGTKGQELPAELAEQYKDQMPAFDEFLQTALEQL